MNQKYLIDANVLSISHVKQVIDTQFFKANCIVIDEIAYELAYTSIGDKLKLLATPVNIQVLTRLADIVDDLAKLEILKTDHGNGDALLLATGLSMIDERGQTSLKFMQDHPVIVTDEKLVDMYAKGKGLDVISGKEFIELLAHITDSNSVIGTLDTSDDLSSVPQITL